MGGTTSFINQSAIAGRNPRTGGLPAGVGIGGRGRGAAALTPGTTLYATYRGIEDGRAVLLAEKPAHMEWRADANSVEGRPGDILQFIVTKNDKNSLCLRQVLSEGRGGGGRAGGRAVIELFREHRLIPGDEADKNEDCENYKSVEELQLKKARALGKIRRELAFAGNNASPDAVRELLAGGINLEKISLSMLNSALAEIAATPKPPEKDYPPGGAAGSLARNGLPVSARNLASLEGVRSKIPDRLPM